VPRVASHQKELVSYNHYVHIYVFWFELDFRLVPPHCFIYTRYPIVSHFTVWAIRDVIPWATSLLELYQISHHESPHCLSYTRCPTNHHICHSQGEFRGTFVGWCILQSGEETVEALVVCDWLVFWVRCCLASALLCTYSQSGYWSKSHSENWNRPDKWRLTKNVTNYFIYLNARWEFFLKFGAWICELVLNS